MITIKDFNHGRIGTQLFKLAFLIGVATKNNLELVLPEDRSLFTNYFVNRFPYKEHAYSYFFNEHDICRYHFEAFHAPDDTLFLGNYQSEFYFSHCKEAVQHMIQFKPDIMQETKPIIDKLRNDFGKPLVAVHVRRRDYLSDPRRNLQLTEKQYYRKAMRLFPDAAFVIFSDDMPWCVDYFHKKFPKEITIFFNKRNTVSLCAMSLCDHHIIANSAFSWWGSWLCNNPSKKIVAPDQWYADCEDAPQMCEEWIKIPLSSTVTMM